MTATNVEVTVWQLITGARLALVVALAQAHSDGERQKRGGRWVDVCSARVMMAGGKLTS